MVFLDVSKAFEKVWHKGLFFKLRKMGIRGNLLNWLKDYMSGRHQKVVLKRCGVQCMLPRSWRPSEVYLGTSFVLNIYK